jgi:hypothetical protein
LADWSKLGAAGLISCKKEVASGLRDLGQIWILTSSQF